MLGTKPSTNTSKRWGYDIPRGLPRLVGGAALLWTLGVAQAATPLGTLDGAPPLIIGHRGLPGLYPEEVIPGYQAAIAAGTDALELDLQSSSDGVLFACHNVYLSDTTDVASHPEFAARRKSRLVDGVATGPDWYFSDFTAAELKTLRVRQPLPMRSKQYDGRYPLATFQEIIAVAKQAMAADPGRRINVYPETKNPLYQRQLGHPLEAKLLAMLEQEGWNTADAPVFVQSFDPASLKLLRKLGLRTKAVQLIDGTEVDYRTGAITYTSPDSAKPFSWLQAGDPRTFAAMVTPAGLAEVRTYADGIGPWKFYILPVRGLDAAGHPVTKLSEASNVAPTSLVADAHKASLFVHPYTFRNEPQYLSATYHGDPRAGVPGVLLAGRRWAFHRLLYHGARSSRRVAQGKARGRAAHQEGAEKLTSNTVALPG